MRIEIINDTRWHTADIRAIFRAAAKAVGAKQDKRLVVHSGARVHGRASIGSRGIREGRTVWLWLPTTATAYGVASLCAHELMHSVGARHKDMTPEQRHSSAWKDAPWLAGLQLRRRDEVEPKAEPESPAERGERLKAERAEHARAMHKKAVTRMKRAQTIERKWRQKVRRYDREERKAAGQT